MTYFLDTNIISYYMKGSDLIEEKIASIITNGDIIRIPIVVFYEIRRGLLAIGAVNKLSIFENIVQIFGLEPMTTKTFLIASEIYANLTQKGQIIEDSDIFIGAAAIENDAILITNNSRHLRRIEGLQIEVWN